MVRLWLLQYVVNCLGIIMLSLRSIRAIFSYGLTYRKSLHFKLSEYFAYPCWIFFQLKNDWMWNPTLDKKCRLNQLLLTPSILNLILPYEFCLTKSLSQINFSGSQQILSIQRNPSSLDLHNFDSGGQIDAVEYTLVPKNKNSPIHRWVSFSRTLQ